MSSNANDYDLFIECDDIDIEEVEEEDHNIVLFHRCNNNEDENDMIDNDSMQWLNGTMDRSMNCSLHSHSCIKRSSALSVDTSCISSSSSSSSIKSVRFSHVEVRTYAITLGDHPSCSSVPALSLDWAYSCEEVKDLVNNENDDSEGDKDGRSTDEDQERKSLVIPQWRRIALLREVGRMTNRDFEKLGFLPVSDLDDTGRCSSTACRTDYLCAPELASKRRYRHSHQDSNSNGFVQVQGFNSNGLSRSKSMQSKLSACHTIRELI